MARRGPARIGLSYTRSPAADLVLACCSTPVILTGKHIVSRVEGSAADGRERRLSTIDVRAFRSNRKPEREILFLRRSSDRLRLRMTVGVTAAPPSPPEYCRLSCRRR